MCEMDQMMRPNSNITYIPLLMLLFMLAAEAY